LLADLFAKMNRDDTIYLSLLIISIPIGYLFKYFQKFVHNKAIYGALIGFLMVVIVCLNDTIHSLITITVNSILILVIHPKYEVTLE
jgi:hypothetical protein